MQHRPENFDRDAWFIFSRRPGKISAKPANAKGWVALTGCVAVTLLVGQLTSRWALGLHPILSFIVLMAVITVGVLLTVRLAIAKGRRVN